MTFPLAAFGQRHDAFIEQFVKADHLVENDVEDVGGAQNLEGIGQVFGQDVGQGGGDIDLPDYQREQIHLAGGVVESDQQDPATPSDRLEGRAGGVGRAGRFDDHLRTI